MFSIREHFCEHIEEWRGIYDSKEPHSVKFPEPMDKTLNELQKIIILRCLRPDKVKDKSEIHCSLQHASLKDNSLVTHDDTIVHGGLLASEHCVARIRDSLLDW